MPLSKRFRAIIILLLLIICINSYLYLSIISIDDITLSFTIFSWILCIIIVSSISSLRIRHYNNILPKILMMVLISVLLVWPRFLSYLPSIEQDYITHIRFEPYLYAYQKSGRIAVLEPHGTLFNNYFMQYVLISVIGIENRCIIVLSNIVFGILMALLIVLLLQKKLNLSNFSEVLLILSIYTVYVGRLERNIVDIFIMVLLAIYIHALLNNSNININSVDVVVITTLTFVATIESFPLTILIAILLIVLGLNFFFTRSTKIPLFFTARIVLKLLVG